MNGEARTRTQACVHPDTAFTSTSCLPTILSVADVVVIPTPQVEEATERPVHRPQPYGEAPGLRSTSRHHHPQPHPQPWQVQGMPTPPTHTHPSDVVKSRSDMNFPPCRVSRGSQAGVLQGVGVPPGTQ